MDVFVRMSDLSYLNGPIDLVGPARVLVGGHALSLPEGDWRATARIRVFDNFSGNTIQSDIFAEDILAAGVIALVPTFGIFEYSINFHCRDPFFPIIFRISILEGAIEGTLELESVSFKKI